MQFLHKIAHNEQALRDGWQKVLKSLERKSVRLGLIAITLLSLALLLELTVGIRNALPDLARLLQSPFHIVLIVGAQLIYIALKALSWKISCEAANVRISDKYAFRQFTASAFVDAMVWPGKVTSDIFKLLTLPEGTMVQRLTGIVVFRLSNAVPMIAAALLILLAWEFDWNLLFPVVCITVLALFLSVIAPVLFDMSRYRKLVYTLLAATPGFVAVLVDAVRSAFLLSLYHPLGFTDFCIVTAWSFVSYTAAVLSGLPWGLGAKDLVMTSAVHNYLSGPEMAGYLILQRMTGELLTVAVGAVQLPSVLAEAKVEKYVQVDAVGQGAVSAGRA